MNNSNQTLDGLVNIQANTINTDELYINDVLFQSMTGATGPQGIAGSSSSVFPYRAHTTSQIPIPSSGDIIWNNSVQSSSTIIYISHLTQANDDIDPILNNIQINDTIIIQSTSDSTKYQKWNITSNTIFSTYNSFGVS